MTVRTLKAGDTSADRTLEVASISRHPSGASIVTVADLRGGSDVRRMRRIARRTFPYPTRFRSDRVLEVETVAGRRHVTFALIPEAV